MGDSCGAKSSLTTTAEIYAIFWIGQIHSPSLQKVADAFGWRCRPHLPWREGYIRLHAPSGIGGDDPIAGDELTRSAANAAFVGFFLDFMHNVAHRCSMLRNNSPDFLTLAEAADYIGVSRTLRRWDASDRLKSVRRPGSGYRFYRRSDLEPFRLEYKRAEQAVGQTDHLFQTITADIEANNKVREPQQGAHRAVRTHFESSNEAVILQIPVGCGKTGVIATLPFGIAKGRALVITPNLTIRNGVADVLDISDPKNFWRRTGVIHDFSAGPFRAVLDG